ncbi:hypothetical protein ACJZ2D_007108 [Fusarium nematophilum]
MLEQLAASIEEAASPPGQIEDAFPKPRTSFNASSLDVGGPSRGFGGIRYGVQESRMRHGTDGSTSSVRKKDPKITAHPASATANIEAHLGKSA